MIDRAGAARVVVRGVVLWVSGRTIVFRVGDGGRRSEDPVGQSGLEFVAVFHRIDQKIGAVSGLRQIEKSAGIGFPSQHHQKDLAHILRVQGNIPHHAIGPEAYRGITLVLIEGIGGGLGQVQDAYAEILLDAGPVVVRGPDPKRKLGFLFVIEDARGSQVVLPID